MLLHTRPVTPVTERLHTPAPLPLPTCQAHAARVWWPVNSIRLPASLHNNNERSDSRATAGRGETKKKRGLPPEAHTGSHCVTAGRPSRQHQRQGRPSRTPHTHAPSTHASMDDGERYIQVQYLAQPSALLRKNPATCQTATSVPSEHVTAICGCGCGLGDHVHTPQTHSPARHASAVLVVV